MFLPDSLGYLLGTNPFFGLAALKNGPYVTAMKALFCVAVGAFYVPFCTNMFALVLPHFLLGFGIGIVDSSMMPFLAAIVDEKETCGYGAVYALVETAVCLAYGLGPLLGGLAVEFFGFAMVMRILAVLNICYAPILHFLSRKSTKIQNTVEEIQVIKTVLGNFHSLIRYIGEKQLEESANGNRPYDRI